MIEIIAAISDIWMVALIPLTRNFMLIQPDLVRGSMTYQPHDDDDEQPAKASNSRREMAVFFKCILLMLQNLAKEFLAAF